MMIILKLFFCCCCFRCCSSASHVVVALSLFLSLCWQCVKNVMSNFFLFLFWLAVFFFWGFYIIYFTFSFYGVSRLSMRCVAFVCRFLFFMYILYFSIFRVLEFSAAKNIEQDNRIFKRVSRFYCLGKIDFFFCLNSTRFPYEFSVLLIIISGKKISRRLKIRKKKNPESFICRKNTLCTQEREVQGLFSYHHAFRAYTRQETI